MITTAKDMTLLLAEREKHGGAGSYNADRLGNAVFSNKWHCPFLFSLYADKE